MDWCVNPAGKIPLKLSIVLHSVGADDNGGLCAFILFSNLCACDVTADISGTYAWLCVDLNHEDIIVTCTIEI